MIAVLLLNLLPAITRAAITSAGDVKPPFNLPDTIGSTKNFTVPTNGSTGGAIFVGDIDPGSLTINNGWTLNATYATIARTLTAANATFGPSIVTMTDGSVWNLTGGLLIGESTQAILTVQTGSAIHANFFEFGRNASGVGQANFVGGSLSSTNGVIMGFNGYGDLQLQGSSATALYFEVARYGTGNLSVNSGGSITTVGTNPSIIFATEGTAIATGTFSGATVNNGGFFEVGRNGAATVTINGGASVSNSYAIIATEAASDSTLRVNGIGTTWNSSSTLEVARHGTATLNIDGGAHVTRTAVSIASETDGHGSARVSGAGTHWTMSGSMNVGSRGGGTLILENSATISSAGFFVAVNGGAGTTTITGAGSSVSSARQLAVGSEGAGTLTVSGGGLLTTLKSTSPTGSSGIIGFRAAGNPFSGVKGVGTVTVTGAGSRYAGDGVLNVGFDGDGTLRIEAGGRVESTDGKIARNAGSSGSTIISGANSTWAMPNTFSIGESGTGVLTMTGGLVSAGQISVGVNATGNGTLNFNGGVIETKFLAKGAGVAAMNLDGGTFRAAQDETDFMRSGFNAANTEIGPGGLTIDTNGHAITLLNALDGPGGVMKIGAGTLNLSGAQNYASLTVSGGTTNLNTALGTGSSSMTVNALARISAPQELAALTIGNGGVVTLAPSSFGLSLDMDNLLPNRSLDSDTWADAATSFPEEDAMHLQNGLSGEADGPQPVPEPGSLLLLASGLLSLSPRRRRR